MKMSEQTQSRTPTPKPRRVKRKQVQAGDGWTIITHSDKNRGGAPATQPHSRPTNTVDGLTVPQLVDDVHRRSTRWQETSCAKSVAETMGRRKWDVDAAVCIGIGSFSLDWEHRHRSLWQLVLFLDLIRLVTNDSEIRIYAQDPVFTSLDAALLHALGIGVLSSGAEIFITPCSFVFAPFVDWDLLLLGFLGRRDPELYVGNAVLDDYGLFARERGEKEKVVEECNGLGKRFLEGRRGVSVPEFGLHGLALDGLVVYWKKIEGEDG